MYACCSVSFLVPWGSSCCACPTDRQHRNSSCSAISLILTGRAEHPRSCSLRPYIHHVYRWLNISSCTGRSTRNNLGKFQIDRISSCAQDKIQCCNLWHEQILYLFCIGRKVIWNVCITIKTFAKKEKLTQTLSKTQSWVTTGISEQMVDRDQNCPLISGLYCICF